MAKNQARDRSRAQIDHRREAASPSAPPVANAAFDATVSPYLRSSAPAGRILATALLIPALPLIAVLALLVRVTSRGPGLYRQRRVGEGGRPFLLYKIRTMVEDAEEDTGPTWTRADDPRVTRLGRLLRRRHLDELPQLLNVVRGEMSIVGPRPERPEFFPLLTARIPGYAARLAVAPGIIGLAQVNLPPDVDLTSVARKLALDLEYLRTASLGLDVRVFLWTVLRLLGVPFAVATAWTKLDRVARSGEPHGAANQATALWPRSPAALSSIDEA